MLFGISLILDETAKIKWGMEQYIVYKHGVANEHKETKIFHA